MNLSDLYSGGGSWFKAVDIGEANEKAYRIQSVDRIHEFEKKPGESYARKQVVITLVGEDKPLGLNQTNAFSISALHGELDIQSYDAIVSNWPGKCIVLFKDQTKNSDGVTVACVRVRPYDPEAPVKPVTLPPPMAPAVAPAPLPNPQQGDQFIVGANPGPAPTLPNAPDPLQPNFGTTPAPAPPPAGGPEVGGTPQGGHVAIDEASIPF